MLKRVIEVIPKLVRVEETAKEPTIADLGLPSLAAPVVTQCED